MESWWTAVSGGDLAQGDWVPGCVIPIIPDDFATAAEPVLRRQRVDLIVLTQSCDLANAKIGNAVLCAIRPVAELGERHPAYKNRKALEPVRRGVVPALHLLAHPETPDDNRSVLYVDFRDPVILPVSYLAATAALLPQRYRLRSPYLEHLSQSFARFFMRVGLPADIPPYTS